MNEGSVRKSFSSQKDSSWLWFFSPSKPLNCVCCCSIFNCLINKFKCFKFHNKKVLQRERRRHTARRVASTRCAVPVEVPPILGPDLDGVPPSQVWMGYPPSRPGKRVLPCLDLGRRYPLPGLGKGVPTHLDLGRDTPHLDLERVPSPGPGRGYPLPGPWKGVPPISQMGVPSPNVKRQTPVKTVPSSSLGYGR